MSIHKVRKGFAYERSGYIVSGSSEIYATSAEAAAAEAARIAARSVTAPPAAAEPVEVRRHYTADRVGAMLGMAAPATGGCHYCGQRLDRFGYCAECD